MSKLAHKIISDVSMVIIALCLIMSTDAHSEVNEFIFEYVGDELVPFVSTTDIENPTYYSRRIAACLENMPVEHRNYLVPFYFVKTFPGGRDKGAGFFPNNNSGISLRTWLGRESITGIPDDIIQEDINSGVLGIIGITASRLKPSKIFRFSALHEITHVMQQSGLSLRGPNIPYTELSQRYPGEYPNGLTVERTAKEFEAEAYSRYIVKPARICRDNKMLPEDRNMHFKCTRRVTNILRSSQAFTGVPDNWKPENRCGRDGGRSQQAERVRVQRPQVISENPPATEVTEVNEAQYTHEPAVTIPGQNTESPINNPRDENHETETNRSSSIDRIWVWNQGIVPRAAINDENNSWWFDRVQLGMTDYIIALNDYEFEPNRLNFISAYRDSDDSTPWGNLIKILNTLSSKGIAPHLMVFFPPQPDLIEHAAEQLQEILNLSPVTPRSIQLDLEGWWTRQSSFSRRAGEEAIREYFFNSWNGPRPELGIGITHIGSTPANIHGALREVDFSIPQMYASQRNYGRPVLSSRVEHHYTRALETIGPGKQVILGQTANQRYVSPQVIHDMLAIILNLASSPTNHSIEISFWSDKHILKNENIKQYFTRLTRIAKTESINSNNLPTP